MDTSETYIKMCEKAEEIQVKANYERAGDWFVSPYPTINYEDFEQGWVCHEGDIWLPRQDQLQEIWVEHSKMKLPDYLPEFYYFAKDDVLGQFLTMEQLWLAFVMKEKYGKIWDGVNWIKEVVYA